MICYHSFLDNNLDFVDDRNRVNRNSDRPVVKSYAPITVEKEINQTNANDLDLNNNDFARMENDKQERIKELLIKNENLRIFLEKVSKLQDTMSSLHKLNEVKKLTKELTEHQSELKKEVKIWGNQVYQLKELSLKFKELIKTRDELNERHEKVTLLNKKFKDLADDYRTENAELKDKHQMLIDNFNKIQIANDLLRNVL